MKHRILHSHNLRARLPEYAARLGVDAAALAAAYDWGLQHDVFFESQGRGPDDIVTHICSLDIRKRIADPLARQLAHFCAVIRGDAAPLSTEIARDPRRRTSSDAEIKRMRFLRWTEHSTFFEKQNVPFYAPRF